MYLIDIYVGYDFVKLLGVIGVYFDQCMCELFRNHTPVGNLKYLNLIEITHLTN